MDILTAAMRLPPKKENFCNKEKHHVYRKGNNGKHYVLRASVFIKYTNYFHSLLSEQREIH